MRRKPEKDPMFSKCANPDCAAPFDYRQGQLFRFQQSHPEGPPPAKTHSVKHFWLCQACSETYALEYRKGLGVLIDRRAEMRSDKHAPRLIVAA
jgi:hypothetical protein